MTRALDIQTPEWALPLLQPARYKGAFGGRGSAKSWTFADNMIEAHVADPETSSVCLREVQDSIKESVKRLLEQRIKALGVGDYFDIKDTEIRSVHGSGKIIFAGMKSNTAESLKSLEGFDRAWTEESQSLSQRSLDLLRPTIRKAGSELWFTWNPVRRTDPIDVLLRGERPPDGAIVMEANYVDNPWFPDVLREEMEYDRARDPDKYAHVWLGKYQTASEARVFRNWSVREFEAPSDAVFRFGADFGFAVDPSVMVRCFVVGRSLFVDFEAYQVGCEIVDTPDLFLSVPEAEKWPSVADGSRPETISHLKKHGFPKMNAAIKGPRSVEEGVEFLKGFDIVVHPRCVHTINELSDYAFKIDAKTGAVLPRLDDKKNHVIDALRYACESLRRITAQKPQTATPLPVASRW